MENMTDTTCGSLQHTSIEVLNFARRCLRQGDQTRSTEAVPCSNVTAYLTRPHFQRFLRLCKINNWEQLSWDWIRCIRAQGFAIALEWNCPRWNCLLPPVHKTLRGRRHFQRYTVLYFLLFSARGPDPTLPFPPGGAASQHLGCMRRLTLLQQKGVK